MCQQGGYVFGTFEQVCHGGSVEAQLGPGEFSVVNLNIRFSQVQV